MQLSKSLDKFVCSSMADAMRLRDLCRRNRIDLRRVNISAVNFDLPQHNISPERQPDPSLTTIYKVLKGEHAVVINVLVDVEKSSKWSSCPRRTPTPRTSPLAAGGATSRRWFVATARAWR